MVFQHIYIVLFLNGLQRCFQKEGKQFLPIGKPRYISRTKTTMSHASHFQLFFLMENSHPIF